MKYFEEAKKMWGKYVPDVGQADTVQGELLRAVEKLRDEAQRNGNINWDEGYIILCDYILFHLIERSSFSSEDKNKINENIARIKNYDNPYIKDDIYDELVDYVVMWSLGHKDLILNPKNQKLHR